MSKESKFFDAFERKRAGKSAAEQSEDQSREVAPTSPTIKEILADRKQQELFGEFLREKESQTSSTDETETLSQRLLRGELSSKDMDSLEAHRARFLEILEASKNLRELLNEQNFDEVMARSPGLQKRANLIGKKEVRDIITGQIDRIAIKEPALFESLRAASDTLKKAKESRQKKFKEIEALCKKYNVDEEKLAGILGESGTDRIKLEKIVSLVSQGMGVLGRLKIGEFRFKGKEINQRAKSLISLNPEAINTIITEINQGMREVGEALAATISESPDARKALASIIRSERPETKKENGPTFQEVASKMSQESTEDLIGEWKREKDQSEGSKRKFIEKRVGKQKGFWAEIWRIWLEIILGLGETTTESETK